MSVDIVEQEWEHEGEHYTKGTPIAISGEAKNHFTFLHVLLRAEKPNEVTVRETRSGNMRHFYAERVIGVKKDAKGKHNLCLTHPYYGAVQRPRTGCESCWDAWEMKHGDIE